jgi:hypothetical protein
MQHKIANDYADTKSDRDLAFTDDNEKQILAMENFNGLQEWNARADSMKELIKLASDLEDPIVHVQKLRKEYRDYLSVPYVNVKYAKPETRSSTPFSAPPKIVRVESNQRSVNNEVSQQVSYIISYFLSQKPGTLEFFISCFFFFIFLTHISRHFFIFIFAKDQNNTEHEYEDGEDYEWKNRVDDDIVYSDDNNEGYASGQSGQFSAMDYFEQSDDIETQFSEDNYDYTGGQYNTDYNNIDEASENAHSFVEEVEEFFIDEVKYTTDGVASRKDKESRSTYIRPVAFNFEDREPIVAKQQSVINPVNSYICPAAIHNMEKQSVCQRPPSKGPPLKRQMTYQAHTNVTSIKQTRGATTHAQISQSSEKEEITHASNSQPVTKQAVSNPVLATKFSKKANTLVQTVESAPATLSFAMGITQGETAEYASKEVTKGQNTKPSARGATTQGQTSQALTRQASTNAQISQSSEKEEITQASNNLPVTRQAATRSTNPFAQKWMRKNGENN